MSSLHILKDYCLLFKYLANGVGPLSTVGVDAMAFLHSNTQEQKKVDKQNFEEKVDEEPRQLHGSPEEDGRPDYQLLFMSSWLLGDYWTFVWKTFGLDGPKAWEGSSRALQSAMTF